MSVAFDEFSAFVDQIASYTKPHEGARLPKISGRVPVGIWSGSGRVGVVIGVETQGQEISVCLSVYYQPFSVYYPRFLCTY